MTVTAKAEDGRLRVLDASGLWRDATPEEQAAEETSAFQAFAAQGGRMGANLADLIGGGARAFSAIQQRNLPRAQRAGREMVESIGERERMFSALDRAQPGASQTGQIIMDPLNIPIGGGGAKIAERVAARVAAQRAASTADPAGPVVSALGEAAGRATANEAAARAGVDSAVDSAGAASILDWVPKSIRDPIQKGLDQVFVPGELTADQARIIPLADEIGWQFLPGQRSGNTFASELALSDPIVRDAFSYELGANRELLHETAARALGLPGRGADFGDDFLFEASEHLGEQFERMTHRLPRLAFGEGAPLRERLQQIRQTVPSELDLEGTERPFKDIDKLLARADLEELDGRTIQRYHSRWRDRAARATRAPDVEGNEVGQAYYRMVDALNEAIETTASQSGPQILADYRLIREQYRLLMAMESRGVIAADGGLNPLVLNNVLKREYGRQYRRATGRAVNDDISRLFDTVKVARLFKDSLGDSGTASRRSFGELFDVERTMGRIALRELVKRRIPDNPPPP